jgi:hypothetical protein
VYCEFREGGYISPFKRVCKVEYSFCGISNNVCSQSTVGLGSRDFPTEYQDSTMNSRLFKSSISLSSKASANQGQIILRWTVIQFNQSAQMTPVSKHGSGYTDGGRWANRLQAVVLLQWVSVPEGPRHY